MKTEDRVKKTYKETYKAKLLRILVEHNVSNRPDLELLEAISSLIETERKDAEINYRAKYVPALIKSAVHEFIEDLDDKVIYDKDELLEQRGAKFLSQQSTEEGKE